MLTQPISASVANPKVGSACHSEPDQFHAIAGHAGLVASEFSYKKDEEIYGEDEPAEYVYQVICGSVRSYKLLLMAGGKSARSTCPAMSSGWSPDRPTA